MVFHCPAGESQRVTCLLLLHVFVQALRAFSPLYFGENPLNLWSCTIKTKVTRGLGISSTHLPLKTTLVRTF